MAIGDHISVHHGLYTHHGIDMGDGRVIHYGRGLSDLQNAKVEIVSRDCFSDGKAITIVDSTKRYSGQEIVSRARSRIGENNYDLFDNNCEHFATWCRSGEASSPQAANTKLAVRQSTALVARPFLSQILKRSALRRPVAGPTLVADLIQTGVEVAATRFGKSSQESERLGVRAGAASSLGIGLALAGPAGAASGFGLWMAGQIVGRATVQASQRILNPNRTADSTQ